MRGELDARTKTRLLDLRSQRPQPFRDDKAIASWNGLALAALSEAARRLDARRLAGSRRATRCLPARSAAGRGWQSVAEHPRGSRQRGGFLDDHANVAHGLLELHVATGDVRWLLEARRIVEVAVDLFADDERGGFFLAPRDGEALAARSKDLDDDPIPSGNSMMASLLLRLGRIWGDDELIQRGAGVLRLLAPAMERVPRAFSWALCALDLHLAPPREIAVVGDVRSDVARAALGGFAPGTVVAIGPSEDVPLSQGRTSSEGRPPCTSASGSRAGRLRLARRSSPRHRLTGRGHPLYRRTVTLQILGTVTQLARTRHESVTLSALPSVPRGWVGAGDGSRTVRRRVARARCGTRGPTPLATARFPPMATTEVTGAEEVAWDLSDLFEGIDDPGIDAAVAQAEADAAAFRERYHGKVATLGPPTSPRPSRSTSGSSRRLSGR